MAVLPSCQLQDGVKTKCCEPSAPSQGCFHLRWGHLHLLLLWPHLEVTGQQRMGGRNKDVARRWSWLLKFLPPQGAEAEDRGG